MSETIALTQTYSDWHAMLMNLDRIPAILIAMLVCMVIGAITGPLAGRIYPLFYSFLDILFGKFAQRMDRGHRPRADLLFRGFLLSAFVIVFCALIGKALGTLEQLPYMLGTIPALLLALFMGVGTLWFALLKLYFVMEHGKVGEGAYYAIASSARINLNAGDDYGITRAAIGLSAKMFDKAVIAPALWYIIGGLPAVSIYTGLAFIAWRVGRSGFNTAFAVIPMALERLMGFVPNLLAGIYLTLAASFTPTAKIFGGISAWFGHKDRCDYEQGGAPISALAWGLNISLGGAVQDISGAAIKGDWVGPEGATAQLNHKHLRRALYLNVVAHILFMASLLGAYIWSGI